MEILIPGGFKFTEERSNVDPTLVRTQITGWGPSFDCIPGLDGSGESNFLDTICFVFSFANMAQEAAVVWLRRAANRARFDRHRASSHLSVKASPGLRRVGQ